MFLSEYEDLYLNMHSNSLFTHDEARGMLYIEGETSILDVFFPGIGMNHKVFISSFAILSRNQRIKNWTLALTLSGFNQFVENNSSGNRNPFTEGQQVTNAAQAILDFCIANKITSINLFGFSYGADLLCGIASKFIEIRNYNKIEIEKMVFSDINLNTKTAFLTGKIADIEETMAEKEVIDKKLEFIKLVLENSKDDNEKLLDNLEYLRASYKVNWEQMVVSSISAYNYSSTRVKEIINFLNTNKNIQTIFIVSNREINGEENGYRKGIENIIKNTTRFYKQEPEYIETKKHFDGISYTTLSKVNNFFRGLMW